MGDRWRPKSGERLASRTGRDDPSGRGNYDEATGYWDWYEDVPEELTAAGGDYFEWTPAQVLNEWVLLEGAFQAELGIDLEDVLRVKSWRWFFTRIRYLMSTDNALSRRFAPKPDPPDQESPTFDL